MYNVNGCRRKVSPVAVFIPIAVFSKTAVEAGDVERVRVRRLPAEGINVRLGWVLFYQQIDVVGAGPAPDRQVDIAALADDLKKSSRFLRPGDLPVVDRQQKVAAAQAHLRKNAVRFEGGDAKAHLAIENAGRHDVDMVQDRCGVR